MLQATSERLVAQTFHATSEASSCGNFICVLEAPRSLWYFSVSIESQLDRLRNSRVNSVV